MFDWDEANIEHIARHIVTPQEAEEALADPNQAVLPAYTWRGERREAALGMTRAGRMLVVVFTMRQERIRVVSARKPTRHEVHLYSRRRQ